MTNQEKIQELEEVIKTLREAYDLETNNNLRVSFEKTIAAKTAEMKMLQEPSKENAPEGPKEASSEPIPSGDMSSFQKAILATLQTYMKSNAGSGVDSDAVRSLIEQYLGSEKVKLSELDQSVLDEIKKNQIVELTIPNFPKTLTISKAVSQIPNFYQIIDDILAGNNVYLIGEAGGGKTYTAEKISETLGRIYVTLNCSQYTSPLEILGGQSIEGFKEGKLIDCWRNGKILIMDEMPKLDPNTAGLFNDALAKSSKTRPNNEAKINSADAEEPPIPRAQDFAIIATGNIYPNEPPAPQYRGNNQQDLSLLDRFSGSVYYTEFDRNTDELMTRFSFLYDFLVGNYYEYIAAKKNQTNLPRAYGLRTVIESLGLKNLALVSYRTAISFRVAFEYELVRAIARKEGKNAEILGKTLAKTFESYLVAFKSNPDTERTLIKETGYTQEYINNLANVTIMEITGSEDGWLKSLNPRVRESANPIFARYKDFYAVDTKIIS